MKVSKNPRKLRLYKTKAINDPYIDTNEAAARANTTRQTIINWCKKWGEPHGLGIKRGGKWKIDPDNLQLIINGQESVFIKRMGLKRQATRLKKSKELKEKRM